MRIRFHLAFFVLATVISAGGVNAQTITTGSLIDQMNDLHRLADFPEPAYKTVQFSSYDHRSTVPGGPEWFANSDGFGNEPIPNFEEVIREPSGDSPGEYLVCDVKGPGAIVRTWTAAIGGQIRLYLDGNTKPVYDGPAQDFLLQPHLSFIDAAGLDKELFAGTFAQRNAGYFPIPFAKGCRIVWIGNHKNIHFYQIQIRLYDADAKVETFTPQDLKTYAGQIRRAAEVLAAPDEKWDYAGSGAGVPIEERVSPRETKDLLELDGSRAIERLTLKLLAADTRTALRQTILKIYFDGYPKPQVECPIGDFFGAAPGINPYVSIPFTVQPDGTMTCRYVMPFDKSARIEIDNRGNEPVKVMGSVGTTDYDWDDARSMHFRARWRVDHDLVAFHGEAAQDLPFLVADGKGVYVGTTSLLINPNPIPTSGGNWWGEGDEKIFVDDDVRPSTFGTGSEDYYNYAWSAVDIFVHPYCGQPRNDGPANRGFVTNYRWHVLDPLPFENRIAFYMELFHHDRTADFTYARVAYHYARPGLIDDHVEITDEDVRPPMLPADWQPESRSASQNSVFHQAEELLDRRHRGLATDFDEDNLFSGGRLLVWRKPSEGDEITFDIPIEQEGHYEVHVVFARSEKSGRVVPSLQGQPFKVGETGVLDLGEPHRVLLRRYSSGGRDFNRGTHPLKLRYAGPSEKTGGTEIGIDFIMVQKR